MSNDSRNNKVLLDIIGDGSEMEYELFIQEGFDKQYRRLCPVSRLPTGKRALFHRNYHRYLRPGETWLCRIDQVRDNFDFVVPLKRVSESAQGTSQSIKKLKPNVASMLAGKLVDEKQSMQVRMERLDDEIKPLVMEYDQKKNELSDLEVKLRGKKTEYETLAETLEEVVEALDDMTSMMPTNVPLDEVESALEAQPDYWEIQTKREEESGRDFHDEFEY